jgi:periplasmic divalent cation tolerance protein
MNRKPRILVALVMCANAAEARKIARIAVEKRLAACGNVISGKALSIYRWKARVEQANEVLLILKTTRARFSALKAELRRLHSYDVPEIIALPVVAGLREYTDWVAENVKPAAEPRRHPAKK